MSTKIEWAATQNQDGTLTAGDTWNPVVGCSRKSTGCTRCFAQKIAWIRQHNPKMKEKYDGVVRKMANGELNWTGKLNMHNLDFAKPLKQKKPTTYFVNSMSDLFHENLPFEFIKGVYEVMAKCKHHTFQILTKRPEVAEEFYKAHPQFENMWNCWLGTSIENQSTAWERIPILIRIPAHVRFLSCEPLLGPVNISFALKSDEICYKCGGSGMFEEKTCPKCNGKDSNMQGVSPIDWVICGGESGKDARPMHPIWPEFIQHQCEEYRTPYFFKQWGEHFTTNISEDGIPKFKKFFSYNHFLQQKSIIKKGEICLSWDGLICKTATDFLNCRYPIYVMEKIGKKKAGSLLKGKSYKQMPNIIPQ